MTPAPEPTFDLSKLWQALAAWYDREARDLPWRRTSDPYRIWISEIMLQQTRVDQALPYYERFLGAFPTIEHLASADLDDVLLLWEGLGYYSRAHNLHRAARAVQEHHGGRWPRSYTALRALPGIGDYTAAAIASIAFAEPHAVVDGNVTRVLSRVFAVDEVQGSAGAKRRFALLANSILDPSAPSRHNQAMMELGARVCTPIRPKCDVCPLAPGCTANQTGQTDRYPKKKPRPSMPHHNVAVGVIQRGETEVLIQRRAENGLLGGLWEFPGGKQENGESLQETCLREIREELGVEVVVGQMVHSLSHAYTHFRITLHAFGCRLTTGEPVSRTGLPITWARLQDLDRYAFPRANRRLIAALCLLNNPGS